MWRYQSDIRVSENCIDLNSLMVEIQGSDKFPCFLTQELCVWELAVYVFNRFLIIPMDAQSLSIK